MRFRDSISSYSSRSSPERTRARERETHSHTLDELIFFQILALERQSARARVRERASERERFDDERVFLEMLALILPRLR